MTSADGSRGDDHSPAAGHARKIVDHLGRIVLPGELRRVLNLEPGDELDVQWQEPHLVLARVADACIICGGIDDLNPVRATYVCRSCIREIRDLDDRTNEA